MGPQHKSYLSMGQRYRHNVRHRDSYRQRYRHNVRHRDSYRQRYRHNARHRNSDREVQTQCEAQRR